MVPGPCLVRTLYSLVRDVAMAVYGKSAANSPKSLFGGSFEWVVNFGSFWAENNYILGGNIGGTPIDVSVLLMQNAIKYQRKLQCL